MASSSRSSRELPEFLQPRKLVKRALPVVVLITALVLVVALTPGLSEVRDRLTDADPWWLVLGGLLQVGSCASYVLLFRAVFCERMTWKRTAEIGLAEQAMISVVPASGIGGLALGAWILHRDGMDDRTIARRSVAFFLIKSSVNFFAVVITGVLLFLGLSSDQPLTLTLLPAGLATVVIAAVVVIPRFGPGKPPAKDAGRVPRALAQARSALVEGTGEAVSIIRSGSVLAISGAIGYWLFDNVMLYVTFRAFGEDPSISLVFMGYLVGQLGGLIPIPGGIGGVDGGLIGFLVLYGTPAAVTAAAVLGYRLLLFWVPLALGVPALVAILRRQHRGESLTE